MILEFVKLFNLCDLAIAHRKILTGLFHGPYGKPCAGPGDGRWGEENEEQISTSLGEVKKQKKDF